MLSPAERQQSIIGLSAGRYQSIIRLSAETAETAERLESIIRTGFHVTIPRLVHGSIPTIARLLPMTNSHIISHIINHGHQAIVCSVGIDNRVSLRSCLMSSTVDNLRSLGSSCAQY